MKCIAFPTDFSEDSIKALDFAVRYLSSAETEFILINVYQIPYGNVSGTFYLLEELRSQAERDMAKLLAELKLRYKDQNLNMTTKVLQGDFETQCNAVAGQYQADCIVMGSKGADGAKEMLVGSNTVKLVKGLKAPLFVIPFHFLNKKMNEFVLSYDGSQMTEQASIQLKKFAQWFQLPVEAVHIKRSKEEAIKNWASIEGIFEGLELKVQEREGESIEEGLISMAKEVQGLLCMIRHEQSFWESLLNQSDSRNAVVHAEVPILVIPE